MRPYCFTFAAESELDTRGRPDDDANRCEVSVLHTGNITLTPGASDTGTTGRSYRRDPSLSDTRAPAAEVVAFPPQSVYFVLDGSTIAAGPANAPNVANHSPALLTIFFELSEVATVSPPPPKVAGTSAKTSVDASGLDFRSQVPPAVGGRKDRDRDKDVMPRMPSVTLPLAPIQRGPEEMLARNIDPRLFIVGSGTNNFVCTFSTALDAEKLFLNEGSALKGAYARSFLSLNMLTTSSSSTRVTAICSSFLCSLRATAHDEDASSRQSEMSPRGSPEPAALGRHDQPPPNSPHHLTVVEDMASGAHRILGDSIDHINRDVKHASGEDDVDAAQRARLSNEATNRKDAAFVTASRVRTRIAFEPVGVVGFNNGTIEVVSWSTQRALYRLNHSDERRDRSPVAVLSCVRSMLQGCVECALESADTMQARGWWSAGRGSSQESKPSGDTTTPSAVFAAGFDSGSVLIFEMDESSARVIRTLPFGARPITGIVAGVFPWRTHTWPPYGKHRDRNLHLPHNVNGAGAAVGGSDYVSLLWQHRDEFMFHVDSSAAVDALLAGPEDDGRRHSDLVSADSADDIDATPLRRAPTTADAQPSPALAHFTARRYKEQTGHWNAWALITTASGHIHVVSLSLPSTARCVHKVDLRDFSAYGGVVSAKGLFSVYPGTSVYERCHAGGGPSDAAASGRHTLFVAVGVESNDVVVLRLDCLNDDKADRQVEVSLLARLQAHRSWVNAIGVLPIPSAVFGVDTPGGRSPNARTSSVARSLRGTPATPLMPFMLATIGLDARVALWICEGAISERPTDMRASFFDRSLAAPPTLQRYPSTNLTANASVTGDALRPLPSSVLLHVSPEPALVITHPLPHDAHKAEQFCTGCTGGVGGRHVLLCLGMRGLAKLFDVEVRQTLPVSPERSSRQ